MRREAQLHLRRTGIVEFVRSLDLGLEFRDSGSEIELFGSALGPALADKVGLNRVSRTGILGAHSDRTGLSMGTATAMSRNKLQLSANRRRHCEI